MIMDRPHWSCYIDYVMEEMFIIYYSVHVDNKLTICQLVDFCISYLELTNTHCWCVCLFSWRWVVLELANQGGWIMMTWRGCWVVCCCCYFVFYESILHDPYSFLVDDLWALLCPWRPLAILHDMHSSRIWLSTPNCISSILQTKYFGGLTSFMQEFSKP